MHILQILLCSTIILASTRAISVETLSTDAEAGVVLISGNNESESYNLRAKTELNKDRNVYSAFGRYLKTTSQNIESARNWEVGARFARLITEKSEGFIGQKTESDIFNGYLQRDSSDAGIRHTFIEDSQSIFSWELGLRYQKTLPTEGGGETSYNNLGRIFSEYSRNLEEKINVNLWIELLPNLTRSDSYLANAEPSLSMMITSIFALKLAYLVQYQNQPIGDGKYTTKTSTMSLVGKF